MAAGRPAEAPERFGDFAARATAHLGDLLSWVCTLNEPNLMAMFMNTGVLAMGANDHASGSDAPRPTTSAGAAGGRGTTGYQMGLVAGDLETMAQAHRLATQAIRAASGQVKVGWTLALVDMQPAPGGEERWRQVRRVAQTDWLAVSADDDFVGVQTYSRSIIGPDGQVPPAAGVPTMQTGWEVYPEALEHTVRLAAEQAGVPILVTENGMATDNDEARLPTPAAPSKGLVDAIGRRRRRARVPALVAARQLTNGSRASRRPSGSWPSTGPRSPAPSSRRRAGWATWPRPNALD